MAKAINRCVTALSAIGRRRAEAGTHLARALRSPIQESRRLWFYSSGDGRQGYIAYQRARAASRRSSIAALKPAKGLRLIGSPIPDSSVKQVDPESLADLLNSHGSDKASVHDYWRIYENFASTVGIPSLVLEVGIGTTAPRASSMGAEGTPGASARAFRDWGSIVIACDIDKSVLIEEPGIQSYYVDQLRPRTFRRALIDATRRGGIDLGIVDGLHTPEADLNTLVRLVPYLSPSGILVVEDIENDDAILAIWRDVLASVPSSYATTMFPTRASNVVLVGRTQAWSSSALEHLYSE